MQIDSSGAGDQKVMRGADMPNLMSERLNMLKKNLYDKGNQQGHKDTVKTLFKVLENLQLKPNDMKVRSLPKTNKSVQEKILSHDEACAFLRLVGFDFSGDQITL